MRFNEFKLINKKPLTEAARIQHAEDIIFWEGSRGAVRAIESLKSLEQGKHSDVTIKWDGSPAVIFGRDDEGNFVFTDKSGFSAKGYDGKAKSARDLQQMLMARPGYKKDPKGYGAFVANMADVFDEFEKAMSPDFRGYLKGDMLYFNTPEVQNENFIFTPNIVTYSVKQKSELGRKIAASKTGIVIHRLVDADGNERPLQGNEANTLIQGTEVLVLPPVTVQSPPEIDDSAIKELKALVSQHAAQIDQMLDDETLRQQQVADLPQIFYNYLNSKVDTGLTDLAKGFAPWLVQSKVSKPKQQKIIDMINSNVNGFNAIWKVVAGIMFVKNNIIQQLESQTTDVKASIGPHGPVNPSAHGEGGEGYVLAHPEGDIKLVSREYFSKANRSVER